jgi:hypothetical protein
MRREAFVPPSPAAARFMLLREAKAWRTRGMLLVAVVIAIFVLSIVVGSAIGSALARLVLSGMERGLVASRQPTQTPPTR